MRALGAFQTHPVRVHFGLRGPDRSGKRFEVDASFVTRNVLTHGVQFLYFTQLLQYCAMLLQYCCSFRVVILRFRVEHPATPVVVARHPRATTCVFSCFTFLRRSEVGRIEMVISVARNTVEAVCAISEAMCATRAIDAVRTSRERGSESGSQLALANSVSAARK